MIHISSPSNARVKQVVNLINKPRFRRETRLFVAEGKLEVSRALASGYKPIEIWLKQSPDLSNDFMVYKNKIITCTPEVFAKMAYREQTEGVLAVFEIKEQNLTNLEIDNNCLLVILEGVEKPGNLGAILRTANGLGASAVVVCDATTDIHNPNVIRNSLGAFFDIPLVLAEKERVIQFCRNHQIALFATYLNSSIDYTEINYTQKTAIVLGTEASGLSDFWQSQVQANIIIPMHGVVDSLNVSAAAAIVMSEVLRQQRALRPNK